MNYGMVVLISLLVVVLIMGCSEQSQVSSAGRLSEKGITMDLWPKEYLGEEGKSRGVVQPSKGDNIIRLTEVSIPSMTVYKACSEKGRTPAVLVCPGGGYNILAMNLEGTEIAAWLNTQGITAVVLKYRVPNNRKGALQDVQRAMGIIRGRAEEFNIDPDRLGVMGFSAGGNLSAKLSTNFVERSYKPIDMMDEFSCRPDFAMLVYPHLVGEDGNLAEEIKVTSATPRTILIHAEDDWVKPESSILYFLALKEAKVPAELHVFPTGGHGYGLRPSEHAVSGWPELCNTWLMKMGIVK
jgi:acetyl esterase/lipase